MTSLLLWDTTDLLKLNITASTLPRSLLLLRLTDDSQLHCAASSDDVAAEDSGNESVVDSVGTAEDYTAALKPASRNFARLHCLQHLQLTVHNCRGLCLPTQ